MRLPRVIVPVCLGLGLLTGCGTTPASPAASPEPSSPSTSQSATTPVSPTPSTTPSPKPTHSPSPTPSSPAPTTPARRPAAPAGAVDLSHAQIPQFVNAAHTITCLFETTGAVSVRCDVMGAHWSAPKPASCQDAYGDSAQLTDKPSLVCHGDTIFTMDPIKTLKAGQSAKLGDHWCTVASTSVSCANSAGRGFTVSKGSYSLR